MTNYQQSKDTSEDLLRQILDQNISLSSNTIDNGMINEIFIVFKIPENPMMDRIIKLSKIKQKLLNIIIDEKQQCVNYFTLPKFKSLSENSKALLKDVAMETWTTYQKRSSEQQKNKKCERYFCKFQNLKQTQQFHLNLFHYFKSYFFYQNPYFSRPINNYPPMMLPNDPYGYQGNQNYQNYFMNNSNDNNSLNNNNTNSIKIQEQKGYMMQQSNPLNLIGQKSQSRMQRQKDKQRDKDYKETKKQQKKQRQQKKENKKQPAPVPFTFKSFLNCVCKGKKPESQRNFQCEQCKRKYHLSCLNIPLNAIERPHIKKICPECSLKNTNALYTVIQPLETFWSDDKQLYKQKITIKSKKCKQILDKKYSIQFKFSRIEGRSMYHWDLPNSNIKQQYNAEKPPSKAVLNQVVIKDEVLSKGNGEDVKISLDCMKGPDNKNDDRKPILLFVALNVVKQKSLDEIINTQYEYFDDNYLDRFFKDRDQIKIQIFDTQFKIFEIPVRGADCEHPDLFDLQQFGSHCIDLHSDLCFCCSKRCRTFKIDKKVKDQIAKIKSQIDDQSKYPHAIYYLRDGTFRWHDDNVMQNQGGAGQQIQSSPESTPPQPFSSDQDGMNSQEQHEAELGNKIDDQK